MSTRGVTKLDVFPVVSAQALEFLTVMKWNTYQNACTKCCQDLSPFNFLSFLSTLVLQMKGRGDPCGYMITCKAHDVCM